MCPDFDEDEPIRGKAAKRTWAKKRKDSFLELLRKE
jgi:hypothetical protein